MLRHLLDGTRLFDLPVLATCIFVAFFLAVVLRVSQRARQPGYRRMATLPLNDDTDRRDLS